MMFHLFQRTFEKPEIGVFHPFCNIIYSSFLHVDCESATSITTKTSKKKDIDELLKLQNNEDTDSDDFNFYF